VFGELQEADVVIAQPLHERRLSQPSVVMERLWSVVSTLWNGVVVGAGVPASLEVVGVFADVHWGDGFVVLSGDSAVGAVLCDGVW
jgi:hypothetical protein